MATLFKMILSAFLLLSLLVTAKFLFEHHLAPTTSGIQGELHERQLDVVLIGSSHTRQSYDMGALEALTGSKAFAIAYDGLDMQSMQAIVTAICAAPATCPKVLVIEAYSANLARSPQLQDPRLYFDALPGMKHTLLHDYLQTHHGWHAYLDLWTLMSNRGNDLILTYPLVHSALDQLSYQGGYQGKEEPGMTPNLFAHLFIPVIANTPNANQLIAFHKIVAAARVTNVTLLLADPPMPAPVENLPAILALRQCVRQLADSEHIPYYDGAAGFPIMDPSLFQNSNHLSTAGRSLYTSSFARFLRANSNRPR